MITQSRKSVLRTFRISRQIDDTLQKEAALRGLSVNALVSHIFTKFVEWDRYAERYGFVSITRDGLQVLHEALDNDELAKVSKDIGSRNPLEATLFWFKKVDLDALLSWITLHCRYGRVAECEIETNGRQYSITLHHALGLKYSNFLGNWCSQAIRSVGRFEPRFEASKNSVVVRFDR